VCLLGFVLCGVCVFVCRCVGCLCVYLEGMAEYFVCVCVCGGRGGCVSVQCVL
jgi:hypothetical protein